MRAKDAGMRCRCKLVLALVQGKTPTRIVQGGLCAKSQVYRVAQRFIESGLTGLADRREDNGRHKITKPYEIDLLRLVEGSPQEFGYRRPTWTEDVGMPVRGANADGGPDPAVAEPSGAGLPVSCDRGSSGRPSRSTTTGPTWGLNGYKILLIECHEVRVQLLNTEHFIPS